MDHTKIYIQKPSNMDMQLFLDEVAPFCDGVQLYVDSSRTISNWENDNITEMLNEKFLDVIIHLSENFSQRDVEIGINLAGPQGIFVVHYREDVNLKKLSTGTMGLENACFGIHREYHDKWLKQCSKSNRAVVFDIPRLFKDTRENAAIKETQRILNELDYYIVHCIDFLNPRQSRADFTSFGSGLLTPVLKGLIWERKPHAVVLEFEQLKQSIESIPVIRSIFY